MRGPARLLAFIALAGGALAAPPPVLAGGPARANGVPATLGLPAMEVPADNPVTPAKVALGAGPDFGEHGAGFARLNFATTRAVLDEAIDRIVGAVG